jgi:spermidine/putrescine transport system ATP-binding protein
MENKTIVNLKNIVVEFDGERILKSINLSIHDKEFVTLLGPSGCGKTTTLRIIGGFLTPDSGDVYLDGARINDLPAFKRPVNTVFQRYALFPHLNVFENVAFGLRIKKMPEPEIKREVAKMLEMVDLKGFEKRKITQLSGGQQQRVAIARALVNRPRILLLDEPLGALDLKLRKDMQIELKKIQQSLGITFVYVTHDQEEALTMSDTVVVMREGVIEQIGTPQDIYNEPANAFIADFIGEINIIDGVMKADYLVNFGGVDVKCVDKGFLENEAIDVAIRPEDIRIVEKDKGIVTGVVENVVFKGVHFEMTVDQEGYKWLVHSTESATLGDTVGLFVAPENIHIMKRLVPFTTNNVKAQVIDEDTISIRGEKLTFECAFSQYSEGDNLLITFDPEDIEVVPEDEGQLNVYLESVIYKGSYNEIIAEDDNEYKWIIASQKDEQVSLMAALKFNIDKAKIERI